MDPGPSSAVSAPRGALHGLKVVEFAGLGPVPFAAMILADHGADVVRIDRPGAVVDQFDPAERGRRSIILNLKSDQGRALAARLLDGADVVLEGFRPGVLERMGLSPEVCLQRNPRLIFGRLSGWGRVGPLADEPGRDISYLALSGALAALGPADAPPPPPLNMVGDYGGGAMFLLSGVLMALHSRSQSGHGQIVDASILAGATALTSWVQGRAAAGAWSESRESNLLDGGAPFYRSYRCSDERHIAVGAIDAQACSTFLDRLKVAPDAPLRTDMRDRSRWAQARAEIARIVATRSRDEWTTLFADSAACVAPVLTFAEAAEHPQNRANGVFQKVAGRDQPAPAPLLSRTPAGESRVPGEPGSHTRSVLADLGLPMKEIDALIAQGVVA